MALTSRHRWCIERIKNSFKEEGVDESIVQDFIRQPKVMMHFNSLFSGQGNNVIFIHYHRKDISCLQDGVNKENISEAELILSYGDSISIMSKVRNRATIVRFSKRLLSHKNF
jgi:hypothetical protein